MTLPINLLSISVAKILTEVRESKYLSTANRYSLMAAIFDDTLPEEDRQAITRIIHNVMHGRIEVTGTESI